LRFNFMNVQNVPGKKKSTVVFLGGGRITSAMLAGLSLAKHQYRLIVHDHNSGKLRDLKKQYRIAVETDLHRAIERADVLIIAVRPSSVRELLAAMSESIRQQPARKLLAISLAAGVPLGVLSQLTGPSSSGALGWARAMPSPICRSGKGLTAVSFPRGINSGDRKRVRELFGMLGQVVEIPESKFDAFTVVYSSSHGYHALATLAAAAHAAGLDRRMALLASAHALADGIVAWKEGSDSLEQLMEEATTPGGIAAATIAAADKAGYARAVRQGIAAGLRRARANAGK
jgi:pyrroline-5-carboxylate reductase